MRSYREHVEEHIKKLEEHVEEHIKNLGNMLGTTKIQLNPCLLVLVRYLL
jgi:hypothetical protein